MHFDKCLHQFSQCPLIKKENIFINQESFRILLFGQTQPTVDRHQFGFYHLRLVLSMIVYHINGFVVYIILCLVSFTKQCIWDPALLLCIYVFDSFLLLNRAPLFVYAFIWFLAIMNEIAISILVKKNVPTWMISEYIIKELKNISHTIFVLPV